MKILPAALLPPRSDSLLHIPGRGEPLPLLSAGEEVKAYVLEDARSGRVRISLKNSIVTADSKVPLAKGETIVVRVAQTHPAIILRLLPGPVAERGRLADHLRLFHAHPEALSDLLMEGVDRFDPDKLGDLAARLGADDAKNVQNLLKSLIFSRDSLKNPLFFREYVHALGYLMEHKLGEALKRVLGRAAHVDEALNNLKASFTKISGRLQPLVEAGGAEAERLAGFVRSSLQVIDSHQVVNYLFQEDKNAYLFQVPLLFPGKKGTAEIFIRFGDGDSRGETRGGVKTLLFLLTMDALGEIVAEAKVEGKRMGCVLRCEDERSRDFIHPLLGELGGKLVALGYDMESLECVVNRKDTAEMKDSLHREFQTLFAPEGLHILA